jgi:hypothetical protein
MAPKGSSFPNQLEIKLGTAYEVYNFGLANRSPLRYLATYDQIIRRYHPNIILLCLYRNDLQEDDNLRPYVSFDEKGIPEKFDFAKYYQHTPRMPQTKWEKRKDKWQWYLCRYSRLYPYAAVALGVDPEFRKRILENSPVEQTTALWNHTEKYLESLKELIRADQAKLLITYVPDQAEFEKPHPLLSLTQTFCKKFDIPFLDPRNSFNSEERSKFYIPGDGHFSMEGHERMSQVLTNWIRAIKTKKSNL